jgi:aldose sugar dehydrogenase
MFAAPVSQRCEEFAMPSRALVTALLVAIGSATLAAGAPAYQFTTVAEGLAHPWSIAFLPNGDALVTERDGRLRIIRNGALDPEPVAGVPEPFVRSQGGLFEVALHPRFEENAWLYLSYAAGDAGANATRVVRARFDGERLDASETVFEVQPSKSTPVHYGGRMLFMPDGTLLVTTGDGFVYREEAQNLQSLLGKVVRLNDDGTIPDDNPFTGRDDARPEIWAYGIRNSQGIARHHDTGHVYLIDHGPRGGDELHLLAPGRNYGWPLITYGIDYTGARVSPYTALPGLEQPLHYWETAIAPAALAWYDGAMFPDWRGDLFVAALAGRSVQRIRVENGSVVEVEVLFEDLGERIRAVAPGPDGALYLLTDSAEGRLIRVER